MLKIIAVRPDTLATALFRLIPTEACDDDQIAAAQAHLTQIIASIFEHPGYAFNGVPRRIIESAILTEEPHEQVSLFLQQTHPDDPVQLTTDLQAHFRLLTDTLLSWYHDDETVSTQPGNDLSIEFLTSGRYLKKLWDSNPSTLSNLCRIVDKMRLNPGANRQLFVREFTNAAGSAQAYLGGVEQCGGDEVTQMNQVLSQAQWGGYDGSAALTPLRVKFIGLVLGAIDDIIDAKILEFDSRESRGLRNRLRDEIYNRGESSSFAVSRNLGVSEVNIKISVSQLVNQVRLRLNREFESNPVHARDLIEHLSVALADGFSFNASSPFGSVLVLAGTFLDRSAAVSDNGLKKALAAHGFLKQSFDFTILVEIIELLRPYYSGNPSAKSVIYQLVTKELDHLDADPVVAVLKFARHRIAAFRAVFDLIPAETQESSDYMVRLLNHAIETHDTEIAGVVATRVGKENLTHFVGRSYVIWNETDIAEYRLDICKSMLLILDSISRLPIVNQLPVILMALAETLEVNQWMLGQVVRSLPDLARFHFNHLYAAHLANRHPEGRLFRVYSRSENGPIDSVEETLGSVEGQMRRIEMYLNRETQMQVQDAMTELTAFRRSQTDAIGALDDGSDVVSDDELSEVGRRDVASITIYTRPARPVIDPPVLPATLLLNLSEFVFDHFVPSGRRYGISNDASDPIASRYFHFVENYLLNGQSIPVIAPLENPNFMWLAFLLYSMQHRSRKQVVHQILTQAMPNFPAFAPALILAILVKGEFLGGSIWRRPSDQTRHHAASRFYDSMNQFPTMSENVEVLVKLAIERLAGGPRPHLNKAVRLCRFALQKLPRFDLAQLNLSRRSRSELVSRLPESTPSDAATEASGR